MSLVRHIHISLLCNSLYAFISAQLGPFQQKLNVISTAVVTFMQGGNECISSHVCTRRVEFCLKLLSEARFNAMV